MKHILKNSAFICILLILILIFAIGCDSATTSTEDEETAMLEMTLTELAEYDGQDGNPAYIAIDGDIYDVTKLSQWGGGKHMGYTAGQDVTDALAGAPHGITQLNSAVKVGRITD